MNKRIERDKRIKKETINLIRERIRMIRHGIVEVKSDEEYEAFIFNIKGGDNDEMC